jgi:hypothetical protein
MRKFLSLPAAAARFGVSVGFAACGSRIRGMVKAANPTGTLKFREPRSGEHSKKPTHRVSYHFILLPES